MPHCDFVTGWNGILWSCKTFSTYLLYWIYSMYINHVNSRLSSMPLTQWKNKVEWEVCAQGESKTLLCQWRSRRGRGDSRAVITPKWSLVVFGEGWERNATWTGWCMDFQGTTWWTSHCECERIIVLLTFFFVDPRRKSEILSKW